MIYVRFSNIKIKNSAKHSYNKEISVNSYENEKRHREQYLFSFTSISIQFRKSTQNKLITGIKQA